MCGCRLPIIKTLQPFEQWLQCGKKVSKSKLSQGTPRQKSDSKRRLDFYAFLRALQIIESMDDVGQSRKTDWTLTVIDEWLAYAKRARKIDRGRSLLPDLPPPLEDPNEPSPVRQWSLYHCYNRFLLVKLAWGVYHHLDSPGEPLLPPARRLLAGLDFLRYMGTKEWMVDLWQPSR